MLNKVVKSGKKSIGNFIKKLEKKLTQKKKNFSKSKKGKSYPSKKRNTKKRSLSKRKQKKSLKGGSCDEYAFVNEPPVNIPVHNGVPGLNIASKRASIGKVKTCAAVNHA
jgi:hypothetical protein